MTQGVSTRPFLNVSKQMAISIALAKLELLLNSVHSLLAVSWMEMFKKTKKQKKWFVVRLSCSPSFLFFSFLLEGTVIADLVSYSAGSGVPGQ